MSGFFSAFEQYGLCQGCAGKSHRRHSSRTMAAGKISA
nr:MAG TPA: DNA-binding transcriptional dual regulator [Caudoviricetes sp.]